MNALAPTETGTQVIFLSKFLGTCPRDDKPTRPGTRVCSAVVCSNGDGAEMPSHLVLMHGVSGPNSCLTSVAEGIHRRNAREQTGILIDAIYSGTSGPVSEQMELIPAGGVRLEDLAQAVEIRSVDGRLPFDYRESPFTCWFVPGPLNVAGPVRFAEGDGRNRLYAEKHIEQLGPSLVLLRTVWYEPRGHDDVAETMARECELVVIRRV